MALLAIETSCDETAAAVLKDGAVLSSMVYSQVKDHRPFGGVVPEIASRMHVEVLPGLLTEAIEKAGAGWKDIDSLAVTYGPGLASSLLVGVSAAKALSLRLGVPLRAVNHLEGHIQSVFMGADAPVPAEACPMLLLLVTGGHTMMVEVNKVGTYRLLGQTVDDAIGEALDKGAKLLGLGYPGGPEIEKAALDGDPSAHSFPQGRQKKDLPGGLDADLCFSFSGLKTSLLYLLREHPEYQHSSALSDVAASYQAAAFKALVDRVSLAAGRESYASMACVGGVAKNKMLRGLLDKLAADLGMPLHLAPLEYCTDNAAMIGAAAAAGCYSRVEDLGTLDVEPGLRLPLS